MKRVTIFLAALLLFTSCYDDREADSIAGAIIIGALFYGVFSTEAQDVDPDQMDLAYYENLAETEGTNYVQLLVDDQFVFIPFNAERAIQISQSTPILWSDTSKNAVKERHAINDRLIGFELYKLELLRSSKHFDNKLFFKKENVIVEVDFNTQEIK